MNPDERRSFSRHLSYVLRHRPDAIELELDRAGWASVDVLLVRLEEHGHGISAEVLEEVVRTNDKQRFEFSDDRAMIRARQGHSIRVELGYEAITPPAVLYHGTAEHNLASIREKGLLRGRRHHVHLSVDPLMTMKVAQRHGKPVLLTIEAHKMHSDGHSFYRTGNNVWLTEHVPLVYLTIVAKEA